MDIGCGNCQPQGEWKCVCISHFDKRGRRPGSSEPLCSLCLFLPIQNWSVCPFEQLSCLCFFWCFEVHQYSSELEREREREINFQQKQLNDTLAAPTLAIRPDPLPFDASHPGHLPCHHSVAGWRRIQMWCPQWSHQLPVRPQENLSKFARWWAEAFKLCLVCWQKKAFTIL